MEGTKDWRERKGDLEGARREGGAALGHCQRRV